MSKLLLIEDDENKRTQVLALLSAAFPDLEVKTAASLMAGVRQTRADRPDLVLLDMTLPNYDLRDGETGGGMHAFGGVEYLKQIRRLKIPTKVIVITQFETFGQPPDVKDLPELDAEMRDSFSPFYRGAVYYHASIDEWSRALTRLINEEIQGGVE